MVQELSSEMYLSPLELSSNSTLSFLYISGKGLVSQSKHAQQGLAKQKE